MKQALLTIIIRQNVSYRISKKTGDKRQKETVIGRFFCVFMLLLNIVRVLYLLFCMEFIKFHQYDLPNPTATACDWH